MISTKIILKVTVIVLLISIITFGLLSVTGCGPQPCQEVCFLIDNSCNLDASEMASATLKIDIFTQNGNDIQFNQTIYGTPNLIWKKKISGYEINLGPSEDSYREYTYSEMFEWKYGRKPNGYELAGITDQQVREWYIQRHTSTYDFWPDEEPRDVTLFQKSEYKMCVNLTSNLDWRFKGELQYPGGSCKIIEQDLANFSVDCPNVIRIKLKDGCPICN